MIIKSFFIPLTDWFIFDIILISKTKGKMKMKTDELIAELQKIRKDNGNVEVYLQILERVFRVLLLLWILAMLPK